MPFTPLSYTSAPAVAILDQNNNLTLSFTPVINTLTVPPQSYADYSYWNIYTTINAGPTHTDQFNAPGGYAGGSLTFSKILSAGIVTLSMAGFNSTGPVQLTPFWETALVATPRTFPVALTTSSFTFSALSLLLGQTLTVTLASAYIAAENSQDQILGTNSQWQIIWPDNTTTGWIPVSSTFAAVSKSFSIPGAANVVIQTRRNYSASQYAPPAQLISQITQQIFVVNQQAPSTSSVQAGLTGDLGIGGQQGFEIVNANSGTVTPEPWEVIARALVRDPVTNELKLLVATSRFSNASSLFGTMALDVFPIEGRPRGKELVVPPYQLTVTSATETVPVSITTSALPTLFVGKSVTEAIGTTFPLTAANGILPYVWSSVGLPAGLTINTSGILNGTPLELGEFNVTVAVQDSSVPFSIAEQTYVLTIATDLEVEIAPGQVDANNTPLAQLGTTLGVAQVGKPYTVLMQVGNIDPNETGPGGLPPYTWSAPAGAFPTGLSIITDPANSLFGLISGTPSTYNSTTDFNTTYSVTIQVTDSIGAKATQTYTMTLKPEALTFGHINQGASSFSSALYVDEKFKLVVPVFGGQSPYVFNGTPGLDFFPDNPALYGPVVLVDGQIEIPFLGTTSTGTHTFALQVFDSLSATTGLVQFSFVVETEISDVRIVPGYLVNWAHPTDGSWAANDPSQAGQAVNVPFNISGNLSIPPFALAGVRLNLTAVGAAHGLPLVTTYTMPSNSNFAAFVGQVFFVSGFANPVNNGTFTCTASTLTTITLNNTLGVAQSAPTYTITLSHAAAASGGTTVYTYTGTSYGNGANNALVGLTLLVAGFTTGANNGSFLCTASTDTTLTLLNAAGVAETHAATATTPLAKAIELQSSNQNLAPTVLTNGVTVALDPTNLTTGTTFATGAPDVEWSGPAGPNTLTSAGASAIFRNSEVRVPMVLQSVMNLASVAASVGGNAIYTLATPISTGLAAALAASGSAVIVTGFTNAVNNNAVTPFDSSDSTTPLSIQSATTTTITLNNPIAVVETNPSAILLVPFVIDSVDGTVNVEEISRDFTTLSHNGAISPGDIGSITTYTRPYIVGDVIGLNSRKPYYDSPDIPAFNGINAWTAIVQGGSALPPGLSLDANTGLIYGTLAGIFNPPVSVVEFVDVAGAIHGTVTINWITYLSNFVLTDNDNLDSLPIVVNGAPQAYTINAFTAPPGVTLVSASLAYGVLPNGLSVNTDGTNIIVSGTPTEAGFFDCWFQAQTNNSQSAFVYHRVSTIIPVEVLTIVGWADIESLGPPIVLGPVNSFPLPNAIVSANYLNPVTGKNVTLVAQYGDPPYTFSSLPTFPFHGIQLSANNVPGVTTAGELSGGPVTSFAPTSFTFTVTDFALNTASVTTTFSSQATALSISSVPTAPFTITAGQAYAPLVTFTGHGSVLTPFNFTISPATANQLPTGLTLTNAGATTATIQGTTIQTGYGSKVVTIRLTDTSNAYVDVPFTFSVVSGLAIKSGIDYEDVTNIDTLGFVDTGNVDNVTVRPNLSFYIVATGVVSSSISGITVNTNNANITGTVKTLGTLGAGIATIELDGSGFNTTAGSHSVSVTVIDSGVSATKSFTWTVYDDGTMALAASNAIPTRLTTPA
jgi:hypothetical protein